MNARTLMCAGAAVGLIAGGAAAQIGQHQHQHQQRQVSPINGEDFLKDLEGEWDVEIKVFNIDLLEGADAQQDRMSPGFTQFQRQLEQILIREGVEMDEARSAVRDLVQEIQQERPNAQELQEKIKDTLEDAGASESVAEREAQRIAPQFHRQLQQVGGYGQQGGVGQRPGQIGQEGEAQYSGEGTATRSWILNETFLQEELTFTIEANAKNNDNPQGNGRIDLRNGDEYEGMGLFAFEPANGELCMVWADNTKSMLHYGMGHYDSAEQAIVFYTIDPEQIQLPHTPGRPGITPTPRPGTGGPQVTKPQDRPGVKDRPGVQDRPGAHDRPGIGQQMRLNQEGARIKLHIVDDNEHVVTVFRSNPGGQATKVMELTYTRNNSD